MKTKYLIRFTVVCLSMVLFTIVKVSLAQNYVYNIYGALARVNPDYLPFTYDNNLAVVQDTLDAYHIQGVAYSNGYYYLVRSRPDNDNNEKLLVVDATNEEVTNTFDLDASYNHPGGIQIYDTVLVIPFTKTGQYAKINFYSISNPTSPSLIGSYSTSLGNSYCIGITEYDGNYLVANYYSRSGKIKFYHFDHSFNKLDEQAWRVENQDTSSWYPFTSWREGDYNYENMSLLKTQDPATNDTSYYMVMYHSSNSADVFSISDPNLDDSLDINMIYSLNFDPYGTGFRYAAGMEIVDYENFRIFSCLQHVYGSKSANVISEFDSRISWPWKLPYTGGTGGIIDVAIDDSGTCLELHRGSAGGANEDKIYYRVGILDTTKNQVNWGASYNIGDTGEFVSVAIDNNGYCVEVHRGAGTNNNQHYYRVGQINTSLKTVSWGSLYNYDTGGDLAIAMDDNNHLVEVHRGSIGGANENKHYYRVGTVNTGSKTISWLSSAAYYATGGYLSLSVDESGNCLEIHRGSPGGTHENDCYYQIGEVNYSTGAISWGSGTYYQSGGDLDLTMNDDGYCLETHRGSPGGTNEDRHYYRFGDVNFSSGTVNWEDASRYQTGGALSVAMNNSGNGIEMNLGVEGTEESNVLNYRLVECGSGSSLKSAIISQDPNNNLGHENIDNRFLLYPNPTTDEITLQLTTRNTGNISVRILDITGKTILNRNLGHFREGEVLTKKISLRDNISPGTYFVVLSEAKSVLPAIKLLVY